MKLFRWIKQCQAACLLMARLWRGKAARLLLVRSRYAACKMASAMRIRFAKLRLRRCVAAAIAVQAIARGKPARRQLALARGAAITLQLGPHRCLLPKRR